MIPIRFDNLAPTTVVKPKLLKPEEVRFEDDGEQTTLFVGGHKVFTAHYETMLAISQMMRLHAKRTKRLAGDVSRHWSCVGVLEDIGGK